MVSFEDASCNIEGMCIYVHLNNDWQSSSGYVSNHTMCYFGSETDNEP